MRVPEKPDRTQFIVSMALPSAGHVYVWHVHVQCPTMPRRIEHHLLFKVSKCYPHPPLLLPRPTHSPLLPYPANSNGGQRNDYYLQRRLDNITCIIQKL